MALSKLYTQKAFRNKIRYWVGKTFQEDLESDFIDELIYQGVVNVFQVLGGSTIPDYWQKVDLSDQASSVGVPVSGAGFTSATRIIEKAAHGLTSASVGKRIAFWAADGSAAGISEIESIINSSTFKVVKGLTGNVASPELYYCVFPFHSTSYLDLSELKIDKIVKLKDSLNGEVLERNGKTFDNLSDYDETKNNVYFYHEGEKLHLHKGSNLANYGTLTLTYARQPIRPASDDDYLDIKDIYVPLVMAHTKAMVYDHLQQTPPEALTSLITEKTNLISAKEDQKQATTKQKAR